MNDDQEMNAVPPDRRTTPSRRVDARTATDRMRLIAHWPERIVAVTDGEDELGALIEYRKLEPGEQVEPSDVEYVLADIHQGSLEENDRLRGLIHELLQFVPYEKSEQGPLPDWIVDVANRACVASKGVLSHGS